MQTITISSRRGGWLTLLLALVCLYFAAAPAGAQAPADPWSKIAPETLRQMAEAGQAVVIVQMAEPRQPAQATLAARATAIGRTRAAVLGRVGAEPGWRLRGTYRTIPFVVGQVDYAALGRLASDPNVVSISPDGRVKVSDVESNEVIGATASRQRWALTGSGVNVAIIDTGIDLNHPDLATSVVAGHRFLNQGATDDGNVQDDQGHGTQIAGIISGDGHVAPLGVAPDAGLVVIKALDATGGWYSDVARGIDWITSENTKLASPVRFINLSLENFGEVPAHCPCDDVASTNPQLILSEAIDRAAAAGITCVAAAGNGGNKTAISYPACKSGVISVGATYDAAFPYAPAAIATYPTTGTFSGVGGPDYANCADNRAVTPGDLVCFSNRSLCMDFVAPGYRITAPLLGSTTENVNSFGTSQATAMVVGALALLQQADPALTTPQILQLLHDTATPVPLNYQQPSGSQADRIDVLGAASQILRSGVKGWSIY